LENGADALLTKPIDFNSLRGEIDTRIDQAAWPRMLHESGSGPSQQATRRYSLVAVSTPWWLRWARNPPFLSVFQLAANMGTSVEMLDDFYGKKRVRDPKTATELTKGSEAANVRL
jgi:hypothetical protein